MLFPFPLLTPSYHSTHMRYPNFLFISPLGNVVLPKDLATLLRNSPSLIKTLSLKFHGEPLNLGGTSSGVALDWLPPATGALGKLRSWSTISQPPLLLRLLHRMGKLGRGINGGGGESEEKHPGTG